MRFPPHVDAFVAPARTLPGVWRVLLGLAVIVVFWFGWMILLLSALLLYQVSDGATFETALGGLDALVSGATPPSLLWILATFAGIWIGVWIATATLHAQPFRTLFAPGPSPAVRDFAAGAAIAVGFAAVTLLLVSVLVGLPARSGIGPGTWAVYLLPVLVMIFVQATAEELLFRGYLLQQCARLSAHPVIWMGLPALLFGVLHFDGELPAGGGYYYIAITVVIGLVLGVLVMRTGTLWAAAGLHVGINIVAIVGVGVPEILSGMHLFQYESADLEALMGIDLAVSVALLVWLLSPFAPFRGREVPGRQGP